MIKKNLLLFLLLISGPMIFAQVVSTVDEALIPERRMPQHEAYMADEESFPAKPRNMWSVGVSVGLMQISGDIQSTPIGNGNFALGYGVNVRKALGYIMSLRLQYTGGTAYGQNWKRETIGGNKTLRGMDPDAPAVDYTGSSFYHNFQTRMHELSFQALINLNNIKFNKKTNIVTFNLMGGVGALLYETKYDALNAAGATYDFSSVDALPDAYEDRKDRKDAIYKILDGEFETVAEQEDYKLNLSGKPLRPTLDFGMLIQFRLHKRVSLDIEHKVMVPFDDLLDGQKWESPITPTADKDVAHYSSIGVSINLGGKAEEPSWFVNPLEFAFNEIKMNKPPDMSDSDNDGVLDLLDKDPNTPEGFAVDPRGVTLDSDKDGCPDSEDPEPFSSPTFPIENCQNVMPETVTKAEVNDMIDARLKDYMGSGGAGSNWYLPMINFDLNRDVIKPEYYAEMKHVSEVMKTYPSLKVEVIGHTDTRASDTYNDDLSRRRAENAVKFLSSEYGIDGSRFVIRHEGEKENLVKDARSEKTHLLNRRVEFKVITTK